MSEDYIRTARAKGLTEHRVIYKHGLRAALTPVVTTFGLDLAAVLAGSFITETIFNLPGIGRHAVASIFRNDFPSVMGSRSSGRSSSRSRTCASTSRTPTWTRACGSPSRPGHLLRATPRPEPPSIPMSITTPSTISTMPNASMPPVTVVYSFWAIA